jgi:hypothetical protein
MPAMRVARFAFGLRGVGFGAKKGDELQNELRPEWHFHQDAFGRFLAIWENWAATQLAQHHFFRPMEVPFRPDPVDFHF